MSATIILPSIYKPYTADCLGSMAPEVEAATLVVWNTPEQNLGVAGSWNKGIDAMYERDADWLVLLSAAVRFGPAGGRDFLAELEQCLMNCRFPAHPIPVIEADDGLGWHLIAFHRFLIEEVGRFDENLWPAYREDNDWSYRIQLTYDIDSRAPDFQGPLWPKVKVDCTLVEVAHGIKHGGVTVDLEANRDYYVRKWGGDSPDETYTRPFNNPNLPLSWWPSGHSR